MDGIRRYNDKTAAILLVTASLILMANGILNMYRFSVEYGIGAGAILQSRIDNVSVAPVLATVSGEITTIYQTILEAALAAGIGFAMFVMSFMLLVKGPNGYESYVRRYAPLHFMLTIVYIFVLMIMSFAFSSVFDDVALYISYISIFVCLSLDIYLEYDARKSADARRATMKGIRIDPSTPYYNLMKLRDELFVNLSGDVGIVDKHFNSAAMSNLYRLMPTEGSAISAVRIITSEEMLDSKFSGNYNDLKNELRTSGIDMEVRIMNRQDSSVQHERFIFDGNAAYKIPPLNIINKKSEHIVKMSVHDAKRRFDQLYQSSERFDNYSRNRGRQETEDTGTTSA
jgi:hypothetical protein